MTATMRWYVLLMLVLLVIAIQGGAAALYYPGVALLSWAMPLFTSLALTAFALSLVPEHSRKGAAAVLFALVFAMAVAVFAVVLRSCLLLALWGQPAWSVLLQPWRFGQVVEHVMDLPLCCGRLGGTYSPWYHWTFLSGEMAGALGGAFVMAIYQAKTHAPPVGGARRTRTRGVRDRAAQETAAR